MDGQPYHRLARTAAHRWWRPWLTLAAAGLTWLVLVMLLVVAWGVAAVLSGEPVGAEDLPSLGDRADLAMLLLSVAVLLPISMLAARWVQNRPAGTLSSVLGRLRWGLLLRCLLPALLVPVVTLGGGWLLLSVTGGDTGTAGATWPGWSAFGISLAMLAVLVPVQAAAEEYAFRGLILQSVGSVTSRVWVAIAVQAVLFAAIHGWGTPWGFADLVVFGLIAGYLTVRTGGLEAAIALHVVNNLIAFGMLAATGDLASGETAADMPWQMVAVDVVALTAYAVLALRIAGRLRAATLSPPRPAPEPVLTPAV